MHGTALLGRLDVALLLELGQRVAEPRLTRTGRRTPEVDRAAGRMNGVGIRVARLPVRRPRRARDDEGRAACRLVLRRERGDELLRLARRVREPDAPRHLVRRVTLERHELPLGHRALDVARRPIEGQPVHRREVPHALHALLRAAELVRQTCAPLRVQGARGGRGREDDEERRREWRVAKATRTMQVTEEHAVRKGRGNARRAWRTGSPA